MAGGPDTARSGTDYRDLYLCHFDRPQDSVVTRFRVCFPQTKARANLGRNCFARVAAKGASGKTTMNAFKLIIVLSTLSAFGVRADSEKPLPYQSNDIHLGVASCANSTCHGAASALQGTNVQQNEYLVWQRDDPHATALSVLTNEQSRKIAQRLEIGPPERADICLDCHADHPSKEARGPRFQQSDGIGCEACHGGAEGWLDSHRMPNRTHAENIADGLYPTADTAARARLCLSCHLGNAD